MAIADVGGTRLFYDTNGQGEPLVLVHGGFLEHSMWMLVAPALSERFRVVSYDWRGHGQSEGAVVDDPMVLVDDLEGLVEDLGLAPAHFAGQSAGGGTILHLAARRPSLFRSMSLHEPSIVALADDEFTAARQDMEAAVTALRSGDVEDGVQKFVAFIGGDWSLFPEPFREMFRRNAHNFVGAWFSDFAHPFWRTPSSLREFPAPVQFTKGDQSPRFFHVSIDRMAAQLGSAEVATIDGSGHGSMLERPAEYSTLLLDFLARATASGP